MHDQKLYIVCRQTIVYMIHKTVSIREDQENWIVNEYLNFSRFIQDKLDEEIERRRVNDDR